MGLRLTEKNAVITGAASGMGLEMARLFGSEGARVTVMDRDETAMEKAARELSQQGIAVQSVCVDVTSEAAVAKAFDDTASNYTGMVHVLVNNAGIAEFGGVEDLTLASWERVMAVNVTGSFLCSQAVLPHMKAQGGSIINLASVAGLVGIPKMAAYCTAKAAVVGLTKQMAAEYSGQGIRVNCLCPGTVADTGMGRQILSTDPSPEAQAKRLSKYPIGRFGKPEEIARAALFLASDEASFVSGAAFCVDGGMTAI